MGEVQKSSITLTLDPDAAEKLINFCAKIHESICALGENATREQVAQILAEVENFNSLGTEILRRILRGIVDTAIADHPESKKLQLIFRAEFDRIRAAKNN